MSIFDKLFDKAFGEELEEAKIVYRALPRDVKRDIVMDVYRAMDTSGWKADRLLQYNFIPQTSSQHREVLENAIVVIMLALNEKKSSKGEYILSKKLKVNQGEIKNLVGKVSKRLNVSENYLFFNAVEFYKNHNREITREAKSVKQLFWANRTKESIKWLKNEISDYLLYAKKVGKEAEREREDINRSLNGFGSYSNLRIIKSLRHLYYNNSATQTILDKYPEDAKLVDRQNIYRLANGKSVRCFVRESEKNM